MSFGTHSRVRFYSRHWVHISMNLDTLAFTDLSERLHACLQATKLRAVWTKNLNIVSPPYFKRFQCCNRKVSTRRRRNDPWSVPSGHFMLGSSDITCGYTEIYTYILFELKFWFPTKSNQLVHKVDRDWPGTNSSVWQCSFWQCIIHLRNSLPQGVVISIGLDGFKTGMQREFFQKLVAITAKSSFHF